MPIDSIKVDSAFRAAKPPREFLSAAACVREPDYVPSMNITEWPKGAYLNEDCSRRESAKGHAGLEYNVKASLPSRLGLMLRIMGIAELGAQTTLVVGGHQYDNSLSLRECGIKYFTDVWRTLLGRCDGLGPLEWLETKRAQKTKKSVAHTLIAAMDDEDPAWIDLRDDRSG